MTEGVYVIESTWSWDNCNTEYATLVVEKPDPGLELLLDPNHSQQSKQLWLNRFQKIIQAQNGCPIGEARLVRLYRVSGPKGYKWPLRKELKSGGICLKFDLVPVCDFDEKGQPIPVKK